MSEELAIPMAVRSRGTYQDYKSSKSSSDYTDISNKQFVFELVRSNDQSNLMFSKETKKVVDFPLTKPIPMVGTINWKDASGRVYPRKIRYVPGMDSIFVDEQNLVSPDDRNPKVKVLANFVKGRFVVDGDDTPRLDFFMNWDINETNENRNVKKEKIFKLVDASKLANKAKVAHKEKFDLVNWCYEADWATKIQPLASLYFTHEQMTQNPDEIRYMLVTMAERNPTSFKAMLDDKSTERKLVVKAALNRGKLIIDAQQNALFWADNRSVPLSVAAPGKDVMEDFVTKSFSVTGEPAYKAVYDLMNPPKQVLQAPVVIAETQQTLNPPVVGAPVVRAADESDTELLTLVRTAVQKGLITVNSTNVWWKYKGDNARLEAGMVDKLRSNPTMLSILKTEVLG